MIQGSDKTGEVPVGGEVAKFFFILAPGITFDDITPSDVQFVPNSNLSAESPNSESVVLIYYPSSAPVEVYGNEYMKFEGFAGEKATVTNVEILGSLTKQNYYVGEMLDYTGISVKITYSDGTDKIITDVAGAITKGEININPTNQKAQTSKKATLSVDGVSADLAYNIATAITVDPKPTAALSTITHGQNIDFTGGKIKVTYNNDPTLTESFDIQTGLTSGKIAADRTIADARNTFVQFTYLDPSLKATLPLTVEDPIKSITVSKMPSKTEYKHGETILKDGEVTIETMAGTGNITIPMSHADITFSETTANIESCPDRAPKGGEDGEESGTQTITLTYKNDSTKTATFPITVNDKVQSIRITSQPTAKNKLGTAIGGLNLTGAVLEVTLESGKIKTVSDVTAGMLVGTGYNANTTTTQKLNVTYGSKTTAAADGIEITLSDYMTGVKATDASGNPITNKTSNYDTDLDISDIYYVKIYKSGTSSSPKPVTSSMVSNYVKKPASTKFNSSHFYDQTTVKVTLTAADAITDTDIDTLVDTLPVYTNFTVRMYDTPSGITINPKPNLNFNYGDTFSVGSGKVAITYSSGATGSSYSLSNSSVKITDATRKSV